MFNSLAYVNVEIIIIRNLIKNVCFPLWEEDLEKSGFSDSVEGKD